MAVHRRLLWPLMLLAGCGPKEVLPDAMTITTVAGDTTTEDMGDGDPVGNGDGDGDGELTGDGEPIGDGEPGDCFNQPPECAQFVRCVAALVPDQAQNVEAQYGELGTCWCGSTQEQAQDCFATCVAEIQKALDNAPTVAECHEDFCTLDELDPSEPYGPIVNAQCPNYDGAPQEPVQNPLGVDGGYCAPECLGLANAGPDHAQTSAQGTCYLNNGPASLCVSRCFVDPQVIGGNQCQCGATCRPDGSADGEGNLRGICTFD